MESINCRRARIWLWLSWYLQFLLWFIEIEKDKIEVQSKLIAITFLSAIERHKCTFDSELTDLFYCTTKPLPFLSLILHGTELLQTETAQQIKAAAVLFFKFGNFDVMDLFSLCYIKNNHWLQQRQCYFCIFGD